MKTYSIHSFDHLRKKVNKLKYKCRKTVEAHKWKDLFDISEMCTFQERGNGSCYFQKEDFSEKEDKRVKSNYRSFHKIHSS